MHGFKDLLINEKSESYQIGMRTTHQSSIAASPHSVLLFSNFQSSQKPFTYALGDIYPNKSDYLLNQKFLAIIPLLNLFAGNIIQLPKELCLNYLNFFSIVAEKTYSTKSLLNSTNKIFSFFPKIVLGGILSLGRGEVGTFPRNEIRVGSEISVLTKKYNRCELGFKLGNSVNLIRLFKNPFKGFTYLDILQDCYFGLIFHCGPVTISQNMNIAGIGSTDLTIQIKQAYNYIKKYIPSNSSNSSNINKTK